MKNAIIFSVLTTIFLMGNTGTSSAIDFSIGGQYHSQSYLSSMDPNNRGIGVKAAITTSSEGFEARGFFVPSLNLLFPSRTETSIRAESRELGGDGTDVPADIKISLSHIDLDAHYYLLGNMASKFGLYGKMGLSIKFGSTSYEIGEFDAQQYQIDERFYDDHTLFGLHINIGAGLSSSYDFGTIFTDVGISLASGEEHNSRTGSSGGGASNIPPTGNFSLGVLFNM